MSSSVARKLLPTYRQYWRQLPPAKVESAQRLLEASPNQRFGPSAFFGSDPSLIVPVIASPEDIRLAQELRRGIKKRYLDRFDQPSPHWSIGVD